MRACIFINTKIVFNTHTKIMFWQGEFLHLLLALGAGMAAATLYAIGLVLPLVWWSDPRYIIPAIAAMLPPAISCASAGLSAVFSELVAGAPP